MRGNSEILGQARKSLVAVAFAVFFCSPFLAYTYSNGWAQSSVDKMASHTGRTWCRYLDRHGETVFETRCKVVFEPDDSCSHSHLDGKYVLVFSKDSVATITIPCGPSSPDAINGTRVMFDTDQVNGRKYFSATMETGEAFEFEVLSGTGAQTLAPWSDGWRKQGIPGSCYSIVGSQGARNCRKIEVCGWGGESGEGGCSLTFWRGRDLLYQVEWSEESYFSNDFFFASGDIIKNGTSTCYPTKEGNRFCYSEVQDAGTPTKSIDIRQCPLDTVTFTDPWAGGEFVVNRVGEDYEYLCPDEGVVKEKLSNECRGPLGGLILDGHYNDRHVWAIYYMLPAAPCCGWNVTVPDLGDSAVRWLKGEEVPMLGDKPFLNIDPEGSKESIITNPLYAVSCQLR